MFRLNKLADYALVVMEYIASQSESGLHTARAISEATHIPAPTVVKILRKLSEQTLVVPYRGTKGGYTLSRPPSAISLAEVVEAMEGPMGFTECVAMPGRCELEGRCRIQSNFRVIGRVIHQTLGSISISDLTALLNVSTKAPNRKTILTTITLGSGGVQ